MVFEGEVRSIGVEFAVVSLVYASSRRTNTGFSRVFYDIIALRSVQISFWEIKTWFIYMGIIQLEYNLTGNLECVATQGKQRVPPFWFSPEDLEKQIQLVKIHKTQREQSLDYLF